MLSAMTARPSAHLSHAASRPMPERDVRGPGRDPRFPIPQFYAQVRGVRTAYADSGAPRHPHRAGPPLLFIHGLAGNVGHWVHVAPRFLDRHRVLAIDLPGNGASERDPARHSIEEYVAHVAAFLDHVGEEKVVLVGHSMGGMVSLRFALRHAARLSAAVLVNPAGLARLPAWARLGGRALLRRSVLDPLLPVIWKHGILGNVFYEPNAYTRDFIHMLETSAPRDEQRPVIRGVGTLMAEMRHDLLERDFGAHLPEVRRPVGVVFGEKDRLVPAHLLRDASRRFEHVHVEEIPRCGHMPNIEQPERVVRFVQQMVERAS